MQANERITLISLWKGVETSKRTRFHEYNWNLFGFFFEFIYNSIDIDVYVYIYTCKRRQKTLNQML